MAQVELAEEQVMEHAWASEPPTTAAAGALARCGPRLLSVVGVLVGVPAHGQLAVRALDLLLVRVTRHAEHRVVVVRHG